MTLLHPDNATLSACRDGELRGARLAEVEAHLASCPRCRRELAAFDRLDDALVTLPPVEPSPGVDDRVLARVACMRTRPRSPFKRPLWAAALALAALAALVGGYDVLAIPHMTPLVGLPSASAFPPATPRQPAQDKSLAHIARAMSPSAARPHKLHAPMLPGAGIHMTPDNAPSPELAAHSSTGATASPGASGRLIARTGAVDMRVPDVRKVLGRAGAIATHAGGYLSASDDAASAKTKGTYAATLTLRVPVAHFQDVMDRLAALPPAGGLLRKRADSQDITKGYHDLRARLQALQTMRARLTGAAQRTAAISDTVTTLNQLGQVSASIDGLQSRIVAGDNSVMFATITVNIAAASRAR